MRVLGKPLPNDEQEFVVTGPDGRFRYNSLPNWPSPPESWAPPPSWQPTLEWGLAPEGWRFWVPVEDAEAAFPRASLAATAGAGNIATGEAHNA